jgi:hypothetical protein
MFEMCRDKLAELQARVAKLRRDARAHGVRLSKVVIRPAKRVTVNMLPKARSGAEMLAAMDRVNSDRSAFYQPPRPRSRSRKTRGGAVGHSAVGCDQLPNGKPIQPLQQRITNPLLFSWATVVPQVDNVRTSEPPVASRPRLSVQPASVFFRQNELPPNPFVLI